MFQNNSFISIGFHNFSILVSPLFRCRRALSSNMVRDSVWLVSYIYDRLVCLRFKGKGY